jgi:D-2-hydroxyacid dehydrogenase (NADP+)
MRDDAYLVNVSRGPVVDTEALLSALGAGSVAGAALDVFDTEPLPAASPIWGRDDVIVTPHIAGLSEAYPRRVAALVTRNLQQVTNGKGLINRVV